MSRYVVFRAFLKNSKAIARVNMSASGIAKKIEKDGLIEKISYFSKMYGNTTTNGMTETTCLVIPIITAFISLPVTCSKVMIVYVTPSIGKVMKITLIIDMTDSIISWSPVKIKRIYFPTRNTIAVIPIP